MNIKYEDISFYAGAIVGGLLASLLSIKWYWVLFLIPIWIVEELLVYYTRVLIKKKNKH
jgi:hypothetical protein